VPRALTLPLAGEGAERRRREAGEGAFPKAITPEGFWSVLKRGVVGTFHKVSKKYLPLYVVEFQFRYNNRENRDIFGTAIKGC
jgi:hypothetical protein